ncbi:MAG: enhanced intracellular survival protein Eis [Clostridia bacterium]
MKMNFAAPEDFIKIKEMWSYCFGDKDPFLSWYFEEKYDSSNTLAVYEQDNPVSSIQLLPYQLSFHGKTLDISYIVGAATLPEARGRGHMEALLKESLLVMRERGQCINILLPFDYSFYRRYGWETCYYHRSYNIEMADLKPIIQGYGKLRSMNADDDIDNMLEVYRSFTANKNGYIVRNRKDMKCILTDHFFENGKVYILEDDAAKMVGYILYSIQSGVLNIHELVYAGKEAYRGLLSFVHSHAAQAEKITWKAPADDVAYILLSQPKRDIISSPFVMTRVIEVEKVLHLLISHCSETTDIVIEIHDTLAEWNNGIFEIKNNTIIKNGHIKPELICSINTFSQLAMGFISPLQAEQLGLLQLKDMQSIEKANKIFKLANNFINDYY